MQIPPEFKYSYFVVVCCATNGVCIFCAITSVVALFNITEVGFMDGYVYIFFSLLSIVTIALFVTMIVFKIYKKRNYSEIESGKEKVEKFIKNKIIVYDNKYEFCDNIRIVVYLINIMEEKVYIVSCVMKNEITMETICFSEIYDCKIYCNGKAYKGNVTQSKEELKRIENCWVDIFRNNIISPLTRIVLKEQTCIISNTEYIKLTEFAQKIFLNVKAISERNVENNSSKVCNSDNNDAF